MDLIWAGFLAGVLGTLAMDSLNHLFARFGILTKIDMGMIGRMSAGWARGRFRYRNPNEVAEVANEFILGYLTHYAIGLGLAFTFVVGWHLLVGGPASPAWALGYGVLTTAASHFLVFPSLGLGVFGRLSPDGSKAALSSLANHLFFGVGMAVALAVA